jgi:S-adenosylmethionine:tRNA-ribosyltransferase-isomerase (queuine synthetase)
VLLKRLSTREWEVLVKPGKRAKIGSEIVFGEGELKAQIKARTEAGGRLLEFEYEGIFEELLDKLGTMPLPPYIKERLEDKERYQTVYSRLEGSSAAPTAGLHFTPELLAALEEQGIENFQGIYTASLGKAIANIGGVICGKKDFIDYLDITAHTLCTPRPYLLLPLPELKK